MIETLSWEVPSGKRVSESNAEISNVFSFDSAQLFLYKQRLFISNGFTPFIPRQANSNLADLLWQATVV